MKLKWMWKVIFIISVFMLGYQVYGYASYSKLQKYYFEELIENINNDEIYLTGINTLYRLDYYQKDPIYEYISTNEDYQFKLAIRAVSLEIDYNNNENVKIDGLMLFINNIDIKDTDLPIIKISVTLDQKSYLISGNEYLTDEVIVIYDSSEKFLNSLPVLLLYNIEDSLLLDGVIANINTIKVEYASGYNSKDNKILYNDVALFIASTKDINEAAHVKDNNFKIDPDDFLLSKHFQDNIPTESDLINYKLITNKDDLAKYDKIIWITMGGYVLIVLVLTYFIFLHNTVLEKYKSKKLNKDDDLNIIIKNKEDDR